MLTANHRLGGWSVGLEAALTRHQAAGKDMKYSERPTKRYDDGHGKDVGLRLVQLDVVIMSPRALPPQVNRRRMTKKRGTGRKYSQLFLV